MTLSDYADALEKSTKPGDQAVARYIRTHRHRLDGYLQQARRDLGTSATAGEREELTQVALLAIVQAVTAPDIETALASVGTAIRGHAQREEAYRSRYFSPKLARTDRHNKKENV